MRVQVFALLLLASLQAPAHDKPDAGAAARMRAAAERLIAAMPERERAKALRAFDDRDRFDWHFTPRSRNGVALKELDAGGREAVHTLLNQGLSAVGHAKVVNIIELELVLREIEMFGLMRDPERYHLTIYGTPHRTARSMRVRSWRCRRTSVPRRSIGRSAANSSGAPWPASTLATVPRCSS